MFKNGFDLTHFNNAEDFKLVLLMLGCSSEIYNEKERYFEWRGINGMLVTANNPITGLHGSKQREKEIGYASYMRLETTSESVGILISNFINKNADVKEFTVGVARFI